MNFLYDFPKSTAFGRVLPKSKIYERALPGKKIKELFIKEIDKIIWSYKLSPKTINLSAKGFIQEIQIITIKLKLGTISHEVLKTIDNTIPSPIIFILSYNNKICYIASYKRQNQADKSKWIISTYFQSEWLPENNQKNNLPLVLDLRNLYHTFLKKLIPLSSKKDETIDELINRAELLKIKQKEASKIQTRLKREKQFNKKVEINSQLQKIKQEIEEIKDVKSSVKLTSVDSKDETERPVGFFNCKIDMKNFDDPIDKQ